MKQVVYETPTVVGLSEITNHSIVGIQWKSGSRVMLIETDAAKFAGVGLSLTTCGKKAVRSKKEFVEGAMSQGDVTAFVFETPYELLEWMTDCTRTRE